MGIFDFLLPWRWAAARRRAAPPPTTRQAIPRTQAIARRDTFASRIARRFDSLVNTLSGLGGQYDKGAAGRPDLSRLPLDYAELTQLYRTNAYSQRFIDIVPADATRKGWKVIDDTDQADPMKKANDRLHVVSRYREALQWARLYGGSCILIVVDEELPIGFTGRADTILSTPLDPTRVKSVRNLVVLDPSEAQPYKYEGNVRSPRFREAELWMVSPNANSITTLSGGSIVHWTRILYFPGKRLPSAIRLSNSGFDDSILEAVWDAIRNKTSVDQAAAHLAQELKLNVLKIEGLANLSTSDQASLFSMRMKAMAQSKSLNNMVIVGEGETFETVATPFTGFDTLDANAKEALGAATGMPLTLLFGQSPEGLNTDGASQQSLWANVISSFQQDRLHDSLLYLYRLIYASALGPTQGVVPSTITLEFLPLDELTEHQKADLELKHAQADQIRVAAGILPPEHIAESRYGPEGYQNDLKPYDPDAEQKAALEAARIQAEKIKLAGGAPGAAAPGGPLPSPAPGTLPVPQPNGPGVQPPAVPPPRPLPPPPA